VLFVDPARLIVLIQYRDDIFKSTVHRAINRSGARRYSIPLFFGTDYDVKLEVRSSFLDASRLINRCFQPIPGCISAGQPPKYEVVTAGEYVKSRLQATWAH
jgi:hypothetical protein